MGETELLNKTIKYLSADKIKIIKQLLEYHYKYATIDYATVDTLAVLSLTEMFNIFIQPSYVLKNLINPLSKSAATKMYKKYINKNKWIFVDTNNKINLYEFILLLMQENINTLTHFLEFSKQNKYIFKFDNTKQLAQYKKYNQSGGNTNELVKLYIKVLNHNKVNYILNILKLSPTILKILRVRMRYLDKYRESIYSTHISFEFIILYLFSNNNIKLKQIYNELKQHIKETAELNRVIIDRFQHKHKKK
jgi:hypothetical protein